MMTVGWKTVVIARPSKLRVHQGSLLIEQEEGNRSIPLGQIKTLVIESLRVEISAYLLNQLVENQIGVVFCDEKHQPKAELMAYQGHSQKTKLMETQFAWTNARKNRLWKHIVQMKIDMQMAHLQRCGISVPKEMPRYRRQVRSGDRTNREGQAARAYFKALFGDGYVRTAEAGTNAALNYGYSILLSQINRQVVCCGYVTNWGIHHCKDDNPFNLSCDLMEPFRPFVDVVVAAHPDEDLTQALKAELIGCLYNTVRYDDRQMQMITAIDAFVMDALKSMNGTADELKELGFDDSRGRDDGAF